MVPAIAKKGYLGSHIAKSFRDAELMGSNPLLADRAEIAVSAAAVSMKPIQGWGATPAATPALIDRARVLAPHLGIAATPSTIQVWAPGKYINVHSIIMSTWIDAGLIGAILGFGLLFLALRYLLAIVAGRNEVSIAATYLTLQLMWELLFSPLSYGVDALLAVAMLWWVPARLANA